MDFAKFKNNKLSRRVMSFALAAVMVFGLVPVGQMTAFGKSTGLDEEINLNGSVKVTATMTKLTEPKIVSTKRPNGVASWVGSYSGNGYSGMAFCADHTKGAKSTMELDVKKSADVTNNEVLINAYVYGANEERMTTQYRKSIQGLIEADLNLTEGYFGDWSTLSDSDWRRATQMAIWMALPNATNTGPMVSIEGQFGYDASGARVSMDNTNAFDYIPMAGNSDAAAQQILNCAKGLYAIASWQWNVNKFCFADRETGIYTYPSLQSAEGGEAFGDYWDASTNTLDFRNAGDEPGKGTIEDAYEDRDLKDYAIEYNADTDCYEILWQVTSRTQLQGAKDYFSITLGGENLPSGTYLRGLTVDEAEYYFGDTEFTYSTASHPTTNSTTTMNMTHSVHQAGEAFTSASMASCAADPGLYSAFFKICVPAGSVTEEGQSIHLDIQATAYNYRVFLGENLTNSNYQPFVLGSLTTSLSTEGNVVWGGKDPIIVDDDDDDDDTTTNETPSEGVIIKVDVDGGALANTVFHIFSTDTNVDDYVSTDSRGKVNMQWTDKNSPNYYPPGTYTVTEHKATEGYNLDDTEARSLTLYSNGTHSGTLTFVNTKKPTITILKVDGNNTANGLAGVYFNVWLDGKSLGQIGPTDADGKIEFAGVDGKGLNNGYYEFQEAAAPEGYLLSTERKGIDVDLSTYDGKTQLEVGQVMFKNYEFPTIRIRKTEAGTNQVLGGALFEVMIDGTLLGDQFKTDENGEIDITYDEFKQYLDPSKESWTVSVREVAPPDGYLLNDDNWHTEELRMGQDLALFELENSKYPTIRIVKLDSETGDPLPNASFKIMIDGTNFIAEKKTDDNGEILITYAEYGRFLQESNLDHWTITVTELEPPENYNKDKQQTSGDYTQTQQLKLGQKLSPFEFKDTSYRDIKVYKKDAETGWLLKGASFTLHCVQADDPVNGANVKDKTLTTDENGSVTFKDVPNGTYTITESNPPYGYSTEGYWGDTKTGGVKTVTVTSDNDPVIEFEYYNEPQSGMLIRKIDSVTKQPIANVEFRITPIAPLTDPSWTAVTDDNGVIVKENLPAGAYRIEEIATVDGYVKSERIEVLEIENQHDAYTITFENNQKNMLNILKLDAITGEPLAGAIFEIRTAGGTHIANVTTGIYGYATLPNLEPGSYVVQEIKAPDGHIIDPTIQTFEVPEDANGYIITKVFNNSPYTNLYIRKYDDLTNIGLEGAHFTVWKDNQLIAQDVVSDEAGFIHIGEQTAGTFTIQEIKAPTGYLLNSEKYTIYLKDGETGTVEIPNIKPGGLAVHKIDAKTDASLKGATFELRTIEGTLIGSKTTGEDGYARWDNLTPGWYVLTETGAPEGYVKSTTPLNVQIKEFESTELKWENNQDASLTIVKRDKDTEVPLKGATFEVRTLNGEVVETLTTGANGVATSGTLTPGWYRIAETNAPDGYILSGEEKLVEIKAGTPVTVSYFNVAKKGITIHKVDAVTQEPLAGAVIEVRTAGNKLVESYTTDASGTITTKALDPGYYIVVETKAPDGYVLNETPETVEVKEGEQSVVTIKNYPETIIQIYKTDSVTGDPLQYAEFEIMDYSGKSLGFVTTDKTGWANTQTLAPGEYIVKETKAPAGYALDSTEHRVTIKAGENSILRVTNAPETSLTISKIDSVTRQPLAGAEFELRYDTGHGDCTYIGTYVTDELGMIHTEPLTPGFYMVKETHAPDGYAIIEEEYRVCVTAGEYNQLVVENQPMGTLIVRKIDSQTGKPIAGAVFKVESADRMDLIGLKETDANGEAIFTGLEEGAYIVTETQAPEGYNISACPSQTVYVEYGKNNYVDFKDDANGSLVIVLQDKYTDEYLYGGHFTVVNESNQIVVFDGSTDTTGTIVVGNLTPGWYTVTQTFAPDKYTMIDVEKKVEILIGQQQTVYFKDATAGLVIEKVDSQYPELMLEGARFQLKRNSDGIVIGEYVTGKDGLALIDGLVPGLYTVTELVAPNGYALDAAPQTVHVKEGTTAHATFLDTALSSITVNIVDANTNQPIPGAVVEVWQQNGVLVNTYTSDSTGLIQTDKLPAGYYVLKLVSIPDGYTASMSTEVTVSLQNGSETTHKFELVSKGALKIMSVNNNDQALSGMRVTVTKIDGTNVGEYTTGSDGSVIIDGLTAGWYIVKETKAPDGYTIPTTSEQNVQITSGGQAVVTFRHSQIYGLQIVTTCQQTSQKVAGVTYRICTLNGAVVGTYTSDSVGIVFAELEPGWYTVQLISAPEGYTYSTTARNIEVKADGLTTMEFFVNQMSSIRVKVVDGTTRKGLYNVRLQLKNSSNVIKEFYTNNEGYVTLDQSVLNGNYTLEMISAPDGYQVDYTPKSIKTLVGETTEVTWAIYKDAAQIQVVVTSADYNKTLDKAAGSGLQGAVFEVMNADTYQVVGQMISNSSGVAACSGLPIGRYIVKQIGAPAYYAISDKQVEVRLKINNDVVRTEFTNVSVNLGSNISVKSNSTIRAGSNMRVDITEAKNSSDVRVDNFFVHIKVPTDAARVTTLSTGSWNQAVFYKIQYKTNMNDYRVLAENLLSTNVYQYGLSTQSLGLQSGEYVTDIRMEFGSVPAGFALTKKACYSQYVLSTVYNGYKLISRVELGGQYNTYNVSTSHIDNNNPYSSSGSIVIVDAGNAGSYGGTGTAALSGNSGQWTTGSGLWTTTVTSNVQLPSTLPKTGY